MNIPLHKLIIQGEHQQQDFKYCINDSRKIAKSLVAFANTEGGRLLIGVKDNGRIVGIRSEEEFYMVEAAAKIYSRPAISFSTRQHISEGKTVLEIDIEPSQNKPHFAQDETGKWIAYYRKEDENKLANRIMIEYWKRKNSKQGLLITYSEAEKNLLDLLNQQEVITTSRYARKAHISYKQAESIIINFLVMDVLTIEFIGEKIAYRLNSDFDGQPLNIVMKI